METQVIVGNISGNIAETCLSLYVTVKWFESSRIVKSWLFGCCQLLTLEQGVSKYSAMTPPAQWLAGGRIQRANSLLRELSTDVSVT
jgi:hypothetical protein